MDSNVRTRIVHRSSPVRADRKSWLGSIKPCWLCLVAFWMLFAAGALASSPPSFQPETGRFATEFDDVYMARMGDKASTTTLQLIAQLNAPDGGGWTDAGGGVFFRDVAVGRGAQPEAGMVIRVHVRTCRADGTMIADTVAFREPQRYLLGGGLLPPGFDQNLATMRVGGRRLFAITEKAEMNFENIVFPYHRDRPQPGDRVFYEITLLEARFDELRKAVKFK